MNRVLEDMLRHFVNPEGSDWASHLMAAQFAINNSWQESIRCTPFLPTWAGIPEFLVPWTCLPPPPPAPAKVPGARHMRTEMQRTLSSAKACLRAAESRQKALDNSGAAELANSESMGRTWDAIQQSMAAAQQRQKGYADRKRKDAGISVGDQVLLSTCNAGLKTVSCRKFLPKLIGPFHVIERVGEVADKLDLPPYLKWHPVFHVALLVRYKDGSRVLPPPLPVMIDGEPQFEVEAILDHKTRGTSVHYLVQWKGYGPEHNSWEPTGNLKGCMAILKEYKTSRASAGAAPARSPRASRKPRASGRVMRYKWSSFNRMDCRQPVKMRYAHQ